MKLALKVDVDTYEGMREGVPNFLRLFKELGIRASFFIPFGPDESGKAIFRVFKKKGFLRKMFRTNALKLYETDIETLLIMAKAHVGMQKFPEAQKFAARAIDLDYNNIEAHSLNAKIEAGLHGVDSGATYIQQMLNRYVITQGRH